MKNKRILVLVFIILLAVVFVVPIALAGWGLPELSDGGLNLPAQDDGEGEVITSTGNVITPTVVTAVSQEQSEEEETEESEETEAEPPMITHGPMSGEVLSDTAVLWVRGNQAGTVEFQLAQDAEFAEVVISTTVEISEAVDFIGKVQIDGLEPGTDYLFQATLAVSDTVSAPVQGYFQTAPDDATGFDFVFGACLGGQGYCRDPETGWEIFNVMVAESPDFFVFTGDTIYVDSVCPVPENVPGAEEITRNLDGFRSRYKYHLEDAHYANFLAQTPVYATWDDHEVIDDFGGPTLSEINPQMFADGGQAFFDYWPLQAQADGTQQIYRSIPYGEHAEFILLDTRSYRDPNVDWDPNPRTVTPKTMLGEAQYAWLQATLANSTATWKFIVTSVPLSYPTGFPQPEVDGRDSWANYTEKSGYETELLSLIFFIESQGIENVAFLTGDTHWPFALSYDPDRNGEANFYEFGSSPISAITLPPVETPDPTLNPTVMYAEGEFAGTLFNFGHVVIDDDGNLTFRIVDGEGEERYSVTLEPEGVPEEVVEGEEAEDSEETEGETSTEGEESSEGEGESESTEEGSSEEGEGDSGGEGSSDDG